MSRCERCEALRAKPVSVGPHDDLGSPGRFHRSQGTMQQYRCSKCGTLWQRMMNHHASEGRAETWTVSDIPRATAKRMNCGT
jgi:hypothetical protein